MDQNPLDPSAQKKKWLRPAIIAGIVIVIAIITTFAILALNQPSDEAKQNTQTVTGPKEFQMKPEGAAVKYAGNPVYDACGLISFDTIRKNVNDYQKLLDMNGTDKKPTEPLTIEHNYIDRDIAQPLGNDGQPRPTGMTIGGDGKKDVGVFVSANDSNCWYGQGKDLSLGIGKTFAKVYVIQKPTPLSADFLAYLGTLNKAASQEGLDVYVESQVDSSGFFTSIITRVAEGTAVIVKTATQELGQKAALEVSETISSAPKGPMNLTYPDGWSRMPNPCTLLTAGEFERATGKPVSALAEDVMGLSEIGGRLMRRSCERLELERLDGSPIAKSHIAVRMGNSVDAAKKYVQDTKQNDTDVFEIHPLKQKIKLADDAYIKAVMSGDKPGGYELDMRIGQAVIVLSIETDSGVDESADAFAGRILPTAQFVAQQYRDQQ